MVEQRIGQHPEETYVKQVKNRLVQAVNGSQLPLVNGEANSVLKYAHIKDHLPSSPYGTFLNGDASVEAAAFNVGFPHIVDSLVRQDAERKDERYIGGIGAYDYQNLPGIAAEIAQGADEAGVVYRVVFGASQEYPLRSLSAVLPVMQQMEKMGKKTHPSFEPVVPPQLQVVFANHISSHLNNFDYDRVAQQTRQFVDTSRVYLGEIYPHFADRVVFLEDTPVVEGSPMHTELQRVNGAAGDVVSAETRDKLSGRENGITYAAAHVLMHDSNNPELLRPISGNMTDAIIPQTIISVGGMQERPYYRTRFEVNGVVPDEQRVRTLQFFTRHSVPPYNMAEGGDVSLAAALSGMPVRDMPVAPAVRHDLVYLDTVTSKRGSDLDAFLQRSAA